MLQSKKFVDLLDAPFGRRGSFFSFANDNNGEDLYGKCNLWLCTTRTQMASDFSAPNGFRQIKFELVHDGKVWPAVIDTTPYEVALRCNFGEVRFTIAERGLVLAKGTDGLTLRLTTGGSGGGGGVFFALPSGMDQMDDIGSRLVRFGTFKVLLLPLKGKLVSMGRTFDLTPDANGELLLGFEEWLRDPTRRPTSEYPSYEQGLANVKADFDDFAARICPKLPAKYEPHRLTSLWQTWNMTVDPDGESDYKHTMVKMIHCIFEGAFVWQQPMQAVWLSNDIRHAWSVFASSFDQMDQNGRIVDSLLYRAQPSDGLKPPVHGAALLWLLKNRDLSAIPVEEKLEVWDRLALWTNYWIKFRDVDKDGVVEFQNIIETGWEDSPAYNVGFPNASPELNAFLALCEEALAEFGRSIGKDESVCAEWESKSKALIAKIPQKFWDGERWFAYNPETGARSDSKTVALYCALILGKRLPQEILDKSIAWMFSDDGLDTPFGIASEAPTSPYFRHGFTAGSVITPAQFLIVLALEECGRSDLAKKVALGYCDALAKYGYFHIYNALTGKEDRSLTAFGERGLFWSAWASSCFFWFASKYGE
ncbi:MAG: hypothetical protein LBC65_02615 [Oscillospiraceae bacterium]|jgi:hypothetical protein|nr:hypothetical protein [Oscillospiraceae bacterium]